MQAVGKGNNRSRKCVFALGLHVSCRLFLDIETHNLIKALDLESSVKSVWMGQKQQE